MLFEKASRLKLSFNSPKGMLTVEDLWDLPLISNSGKANLDEIATNLFRQLKDTENVSFVVKTQMAEPIVQLQFDIVKHIINVRLVENEAARTASANAAKKQQILAIISGKENDELASTSVEDLRKMAEAL